MDPVFMSSGDLIADRRAAYAAMMVETGDLPAAAELWEQALELAPGWAAGWNELGIVRERLGELGTAIRAWSRAAELDPEGGLGAQVRLSAHGGDAEAEAQRRAYVETLFDQYAPRFETELVEGLDYVVPDLLAGMIAEAVKKYDIGQFARAADLGSGTGLMGERVAHLVSFLEGVDLSEAMNAQCAQKGVYGRLEQGDVGAFLAGRKGAFDLITAADVFMYCGALEDVMRSAFAALREGGLFVFSVERHDGPESEVLRTSLRYAHNAEHLQNLLLLAGFELVEERTETIRLDRGEPVQGALFVARRPVLAPVGEVDLPLLAGRESLAQ